jgi:hypothetical protein
LEDINNAAVTTNINPKKINLIIKKGDVLSDNDLINIDIAHAKSVIVLDDSSTIYDLSDDDCTTADMFNVKILIAISKFLRKTSHIVVETESHDTVKLIVKLQKDYPEIMKSNIYPYSFIKKIGELLAISIFHPDIIKVYENILSLKEVTITAKKYEGGVKEYLENENKGIPFYKDDELYVLDNQLQHFNNKIYRDTHIVPFETITKYIPKKKEVFILGVSTKTPFIKRSLQPFIKRDVVNLHTYKFDEEQQLIKDLTLDTEPKTLIILSDESVNDDYIDTNCILSTLKISKYVEKYQIALIVEIINPINYPLLKSFNVPGVLVSNRIISYLASQSLINFKSKNFFDMLFTQFTSDTKDVFDIWVDRLDEVIVGEFEPLEFSCYGDFIRSMYHNSNNTILPIAYKDKVSNELVYFNMLNEECQFVVYKDTEIVFIRYNDTKEE